MVRRVTGGRGVDIVLDAVGGSSLARSYRCLAPLGRLFTFGGSGFAPKGTRNPLHILKAYFAMPSFKPFALMDRNRGVFGSVSTDSRAVPLLQKACDGGIAVACFHVGGYYGAL